MKKLIILLLTLTGMTLQLSAEIKFARQQAIEEIDSLVRMIEDVEVDPYMSLPKETFYKAVSDTKASLTDDSISIYRHFLNLTALTGMFRQGHLQVMAPDNVWQTGLKIFPFAGVIKITPGSNEATIDADVEIDGLSLPRGTKLLAINGQDIDDITKRYLDYTSGETDNYRCSSLSKGLFGVYLSFENPDAQSYNVRFIGADGKENSHDFKAKSLREIPMRPQENSSPYNYELLNDSVMLFSFNSCKLDNFKRFARQMFGVAKRANVRHIIIDIRKNAGGNSETGDEICRYITDRPFSSFGGMKAKFSHTLARHDRTPYTGDRIVDRTTSMNEYDLYLPYDPAYRFDGKTYLLTSNETFSSAANFAWAYSKFVPGTIIGEETGGVNIAVGDVINCMLPHSNFRLIVPWKIFYQYGATDGDPIQGTIPHIQVPADQALNKALDYIQGK